MRPTSYSIPAGVKGITRDKFMDNKFLMFGNNHSTWNIPHALSRFNAHRWPNEVILPSMIGMQVPILMHALAQVILVGSPL